jgi:hypothetical protein
MWGSRNRGQCVATGWTNLGSRNRSQGQGPMWDGRNLGLMWGNRNRGHVGQLEWGQCGTTGTGLYVEPQEQGQRGQHK